MYIKIMTYHFVHCMLFMIKHPNYLKQTKSNLMTKKIKFLEVAQPVSVIKDL